MEIGHPLGSIEDRLNPVFQDAIDSGRVPGVAAVALDATGRVLFSKGYGLTTSTGEPGQNNRVTPNTPAYIFSCTKLVTTVAALQLIEQKKLSLDDLVETYVPSFAKIQVLEGFDEKGQPVLRAPRTKAKIINLLTHTAGLTYDFFDKDTLRYRIATGATPANYGNDPTVAYYSTPLKFDPGQAYTYGTNTDILGVVIEKVSGLRVDAYIKNYITQPLGLANTGFGLEGPGFFNLHFRDEAGKFAESNLRVDTKGEMAPGGQFLTSTAEDYAQFLLTILNFGTHPKSKVHILKKDTVKKYIFEDQLDSIKVSNKGVGEVVSSLPQLSSGGTMLPGIKKGWSLGLMTNAEHLPNGRKAGSGAWAGLDNCYYWMDPAAGRLGFLLGSSFPWFDKDVLHLFDSLERAVYGKFFARVPGEPGSNFSGGDWWKD